MASSADHQQEAASQQHQQELVKLLTRHFHHQFYHMAAANAAASHHHQHPQQLPTSALAPNPSSLGLRSATSYQQRTHYQPIFAGGFDLSSGIGSEPDANASQQQQLQLHNQILRSQPPNSSNGNSNNNNSNSANDRGPMNNTPLLDYTLRSSLNPYNLPPELNLFNALGLSNLNNSQQLVLNLQQQHQALLQQAAAAASAQTTPNRQHYGLKGDSNSGTGGLNQHLSEQSEERIRSSPPSGCREPARESPEADGKQFLKFSINTILGRTVPTSSPKPVDSIEIIKQHLEQQQQKPFDVSTLMARRANQQQMLDKMMMSNNIKREPKEDELDESSSDTSISSSINTSTTPSLMLASSQAQTQQSILFNPSHHSANNNSNTNTNINTNLAHSNKTGQANLQRQQQHHHQANNGHPSLPFLNGPVAAFPWTVAARGKPRRGMMRRAVFSDSQRVGLERRFQLQKYISKPDRKKLAEKLGLRDSQVKIWFQNRRMKWRNSKERELLSAGGSREQTLPTRNNPNPDLSDVGETIKRLASATATTTTATAAITANPSPSLPIALNK